MNPYEQLQQQVNAAHGRAHAALGQAQEAKTKGDFLEAQVRGLIQTQAELKSAMLRIETTRSGSPKIQRVENIPGRRIPFDLLVDIAINANSTSVQQGTITISQEGPFVAVSRFATLLSVYEFQRQDPETGALATFLGRSYGRYRPIHSAWDLNDGQPSNDVSMAQAFPGTGAPHVASPSNQSPFRTMEGDFRIKFEDAGSSYPRSNNIEVPSSFWTKQINSPFELGALDVFERGEVLSFKILPLHANNPPFGNLSGFGVPNANFPFIDSGWDAIEGINDENDSDANTTDPITRVANAILTIGFHGYRIVQPPGAGPY
jgi:hypothetical protein